MEGSRTSLRKWVTALFLLSRTNRGTSAIELMTVIGVTYKTAWLMLHKIRNAISQADAEIKLQQPVRIQATVYGKPYNSSIFRHPQEHPLLVGASMLNDEKIEYVKIKPIDRVHLLQNMPSKWAASAFVSKHVVSGAHDIEWSNNQHSRIRRFKSLIDCAKQAAQWLNTTIHGIGPKHLHAYLNEFCFRQNEASHGQFILSDLLGVCSIYVTVTYRQLIKPPVPARWQDFDYVLLSS